MSEMIQKFMRQIKAKSRASSTVNTLERSLVKAQEYIGKPLEKASSEELLGYIEHLNGRYTGNTLALYEFKLIQFYRFCFDETDDVRYNKIVKRLKSLNTGFEKNNINPLELLLPEDIKRLINVATIERDRCIVAVLFESGLRKGELLALTNSMITMDEHKQEVTFNIPNQEGCKTGSRSVVCLQIYGYVQDWMKCNTSDRFMPMSPNGLKYTLIKLFNKAGINKPCNPHMFRHSSITHAVNINMQPNAISERYWGISNSNMLSTYIHLSEQMQANAYRNAMGMNGDNAQIINPIACRCANCGRLIQTGNLCISCKENADLKLKVSQMENLLNAMITPLQQGKIPNNIGFNSKQGKFYIVNK